MNVNCRVYAIVAGGSTIPINKLLRSAILVRAKDKKCKLVFFSFAGVLIDLNVTAICKLVVLRISHLVMQRCDSQSMWIKCKRAYFLYYRLELFSNEEIITVCGRWRSKIKLIFSVEVCALPQPVTGNRTVLLFVIEPRADGIKCMI